ncbi:MAG TPA: succinylglutamate desuccinylase/aspartoacylase family protein [Casimicrobiaceae bacterium]|jgi:predicted deacylase
MRPSTAPPNIEIDLPDLSHWAKGNAGIPYVWRFESGRAGPRLAIQALTHGNEVCGAIALCNFLDADFRPSRGTLTLIFANVDAYFAFDASDPFASRCVDEDMNRVWTADVLDGKRQSHDLARARALRPIYDGTEYLLDLHSMTDPCPPLALAGRQRKGLELAYEVGLPEHVVIDAGHKAGRRLRDYAFFDDPDDPRSALLIECGQHWERKSPVIAMQAALRFLRHFGMASPEFLDARLDHGPLRPQHAIEITDVVTIDSDDFSFVIPAAGLDVVAKRGTLLARDGSIEIRTPYDNCVLVMPARRPRRGETAVRLGRFVS